MSWGQYWWANPSKPKIDAQRQHDAPSNPPKGKTSHNRSVSPVSDTSFSGFEIDALWKGQAVHTQGSNTSFRAQRINADDDGWIDLQGDRAAEEVGDEEQSDAEDTDDMRSLNQAARRNEEAALDEASSLIIPMEIASKTFQAAPKDLRPGEEEEGGEERFVRFQPNVVARCCAEWKKTMCEFLHCVSRMGL